MNGTFLQRLKENLVERRTELASWFNQAPSSLRKTRVGPNGEDTIRHQIEKLDEAICCAEDDTLGVCEVCHEHVGDSALEMDFESRICLEHLTGIERDLLENDLELSQKVQRALLPHELPRVSGLDIAAYSQPAQMVGGDYFDFFTYGDGAHGFVIADVMGKGMAASLLMASFQASLRIIAPESIEPHDVLTRLNRIFRHNIRLTKFVTVFLARYDATSGTLHYANAGHNPPLLLSQSGEIRLLRPTGAAIGLAEQSSFTTDTAQLREGDRLLVFTDGVVELPNASGELFGDERLIEFFAQGWAGRSSREILGLLRSRLEQFSGSAVPKDDTTMIVVSVGAVNRAEIRSS